MRRPPPSANEVTEAEATQPADQEGWAPTLMSHCCIFLCRFKSRRIRTLVMRLLYRLEGAHYQFYSQALRTIFRRYYGVEVGMYSHGGCFVPGRFPVGTKVGRYCSIATTAQALRANHPMNLKSSHAFFFNPSLGIAKEYLAPTTQLIIGNDVWIGHGAIILPSVRKISDGAVVAAGAVVNKNVPPYSVVVGNPCRVVRYRFSKELIEELLEEKWWLRPIEAVAREFEEFQRPLESEGIR